MDIHGFRENARKYTLSNKGFNKLFCIGYNKTGSTSIEQVFYALGYNCPNQSEQEITLVKQLYAGNFRPLVEFCSQYDAFQDQPFSNGMVYAQVDCLFPGSKFILTVRDSDNWYDSLVRFHRKVFFDDLGIDDLSSVNEDTLKDKELYLYKNYSYENARRFVEKINSYELIHDWSLLYNREHRINLYEKRNEQIISYFQGRENDLLILDLEKEENIGTILDFLDLPETLNMPMPHRNRSK